MWRSSVSRLLLVLVVASTCAAAAHRPQSVYEIYWDAGQPDCLEGGNCSNTRDSVDVTRYGLRGTNWTETASNPERGDPGRTFPVILSNGTALYGGVPQAGDLSAHLVALRSSIEAWIPDEQWVGNAVFDFEKWCPVWELTDPPYRTLSIELVKAAHPDWPAAKVSAQAKQEFEAAALEWFVRSLEIAKAVRPLALWGYYGFPKVEMWVDGWHELAFQQQPLVDASTALYPDIYLHLPSASEAPDSVREQELAHVNTTVTVATQMARQVRGDRAPPVYPFASVFNLKANFDNGKYHHPRTELLTRAQAPFEFLWPYDLGARGIVIWSGLGEEEKLDSDKEANRRYWSNFSQVYGPMIQSFLMEVDACSTTHCSGPEHGRCLPHNSTYCHCEEGWSGETCNVSTHGKEVLPKENYGSVVAGRRFDSLWNQPWPSWCKKESTVEPSATPNFAAFRIRTNPRANHSWDSFIDPGEPSRFPGFVGPVIDTLYKAGNWPSLECKGGRSTCAPADAIVRFGGIPQVAVHNLSAHLYQLKIDIERQIPDPHWSGLASIDWEAWRPLWSDMVSRRDWVYINASIELARSEHPELSPEQLTAQAEKDFNAAAQQFVTATVRRIKELRPHGLWGLYNYPGPPSRSFQNLKLPWLFDELDVLLPSVYLGDGRDPKQNRLDTDGILQEARRVRDDVLVRTGKQLPIYSFAWPDYDGWRGFDRRVFMSDADIETTLVRPATVWGLSGSIIWGDSADTENKTRCGDGPASQAAFLNGTLGPALLRAANAADACALQRCSAHGRCWGEGSSAACDCDLGWSGKSCAKAA